ncbi:hydroxysqualene dehydroxylase HpnE [Thalassospiraceae bacterium LMO-JJ14]|nr:hydroxysqualene dehydroxylase HpnE [Thalassospiraceae bacterium LMO-JJ14]
MTTRKAFVLGGGVAGLAAATSLCEQGVAVTLIEAAPQAGGRCRSFFDKQLGCDIDNGNHLVLSGNVDAMRYLARTGAMETIDILPACLPFQDVGTGETWEVALGKGRIPWRLLCPHHGIPGVRLRDFWRSRKLFKAGPDACVADVLKDTGQLYERFWKPFAIAVLNTEPERAAAALLAPVIRETVMQGGMSCRPVLAKRGLGFSFVDPALAYLRAQGADVRLGVRCRGLNIQDTSVRALDLDGETIRLADDDIVISALPPSIAGELIAGVSVPDEFRAIVNVHFDIGGERRARIIGILGGLAEWLFLRGNIASVTISAADHVVDETASDIAARIWHEIARILAMNPDILPPVRVIKEKRATFAQTPQQISRRSGPETGIRNLWLAGDWTDTGLPATIEGAIRSGHRCTGLALNR